MCVHTSLGRETHTPFPKILTILGGPLKALNMTVILPFPGSYRCASVSEPLPVSSMYQNVRASIMPKYSPPLGETLTWPDPESGAVATQNICCSRIHLMSDSGIAS